MIEARDVIPDVITATLRREFEADLAKSYQQGRRRAEAALLKHGEREAAQALPATCPYTFDEIVSHDWYPANHHSIVDHLADARARRRRAYPAVLLAFAPRVSRLRQPWS